MKPSDYLTFKFSQNNRIHISMLDIQHSILHLVNVYPAYGAKAHLDYESLNNVPNNNEKFRSFKSKENIHKKEVGPSRGFGY